MNSSQAKQQADGHRPRIREASTFEVFDCREWRSGGAVSHGVFDTIDEARGCVEYDGLRLYEIWQGDHIVEEGDLDALRKRLEQARGARRSPSVRTLASDLAEDRG